MRAFYAGKRVLVTGHTGFKGSWLCQWLDSMGAHVIGYAKPPEATPDSLFSLLRLNAQIESHYGDISDFEKLRATLQNAKPDIVFHLAAQSLVLPSYEAPIETFATNVMGTVHLLEAARHTGSIKAIANVTTDKCYENHETAAAFREEDRLGGHDPYSSSKAAAEIVSAGYRDAFLSDAGIAMATARAGNVIGGGDFSRHRLIPDIIRAAKAGTSVNLRHPESIRPWQYVLDVLYGYLLLGKALYEQGEAFAGAYNFGPDESNVTVKEVAERLLSSLPQPPVLTYHRETTAHEAGTLNLDNTKAKSKLGWSPRMSTVHAVEHTAQWYRHYLIAPTQLSAITLEQLHSYDAA